MAESDFPSLAKDPSESFWVLQGLDEAHSAFLHPDLTAMVLLENCGRFSHLVGTFTKGQLQFYFAELLYDHASQPKSLSLTEIPESPSAQQFISQQVQLKDKDVPSKICIVKSTVESDSLAEREAGNLTKHNKMNDASQSQNQGINNPFENEDYFSCVLNGRSTKTTQKAVPQAEFFQATVGICLERMVYLCRVNFSKNESQSWVVSLVEVRTYEYNGQIVKSIQLSENGHNMLCSVFDPAENLVSVCVESTKNAANRCLIGSFNQSKEVLIGRIAASSDMSLIRAFFQIASNKQMYLYTFYFDAIRQQLQTLNRLPITTSLSSSNNPSSNPLDTASCSLFSETCGVGVMSDGCSLEIHDFNAHSSKPVLKEASMQIYNFDPQTLLVANSTRNISSNNTTFTPINTPNTITPSSARQPSSSSLAFYSYNAPYSALETIPLPSPAKVHNIVLCPCNSTFDGIEGSSSFSLILAIMADECSSIIPIIIDTSILQDKLPELQTVGSQITLFGSRIDFDSFPSKNVFKTPEAAKMSNNFFNFSIFSSLGLSLSQNVEYASPEKPSRQTQSQEQSQGNQRSKGENTEHAADTEQRQNRLLFTENSINQEASKYSFFDEERKESQNEQQFSSPYSIRPRKQADFQNGCMLYHKEQDDDNEEEQYDSSYQNGEELDNEESNAFCSNSSDSKGECEKCRFKKHTQLKKKIMKNQNYLHHYSQNSSNDIIIELSQSQPLNSDDMDYEDNNDTKSKSKIISFPTKKSKKAPRSKKRTSCGYFDSEGELPQQEHEFSFNDLSNSPCKSASPIRQPLSPLKTKKKPFSFSLNMVSPPAATVAAKSISGSSSSTLPAFENSKDFCSLESSNSFIPHQLLVKRKISPTRLSNFSQQHLQSKSKLLHFS